MTVTTGTNSQIQCLFQYKLIVYIDVFSEIEQLNLDVKVDSMLEDEVGWLQNFVPSDNDTIAETDNYLIAGHLKLIRTLLTCQKVNKREYG